MPKHDDPRITIRVGGDDLRRLTAGATLAGVKLGTFVRNAALAAAPSAPEPTMAPPPADPVPPAASLPFGCRAHDCGFEAASPAAICPTHGRRVMPR